MTEQKKRGGPGRGQGRKPVKTGEDTVTVSLRMAGSQRDKLERLGGAGWVRDQIDEAPDGEQTTRKTIRNPFKTKLLADAFEGAVKGFETRHKTLFASDGQPNRLNGYGSAFWRGYYGEVGMVVKGTLAHAMFRAGEACRRAFNVEFTRNGMTTPLGSERHYPQHNPESKS